MKPILNLPILTKDNKSEYPEWHTYYEKVYKKSITNDVDLNTFNWFYWFSPLGKIDVYKIPSWRELNKKKNSIPFNIPFIFAYNQDLSSESVMGKAGFFIRKNLELTDNFIEVYRVNISVFKEKGVCWFFNTIGSGFYLKFDKSFIGSRNEIKGWIENKPFQSLKNRKINTFIINKEGFFSHLGLIEIVFGLKEANVIANTAELPLFRGGKRYIHTYDKFTHCMT